MPCTYWTSPAEEAAYNAEQQQQKKNQEMELKHVKEELDTATRLLCAVVSELECKGLYGEVKDLENGQVNKWWISHQKMDAARLKAEAKQKKIEKLERELAKLKKSK